MSDPETAEEAPKGRSPGMGVLIFVAAYLLLFPAFTVLYVAYSDAQTAAQVKAYEAQQVAANNRKFCGIVDTLLAPHPPSGSAASNPSRAFDQVLHAKVVQLKEGLECLRLRRVRRAVSR